MEELKVRKCEDALDCCASSSLFLHSSSYFHDQLCESEGEQGEVGNSRDEEGQQFCPSSGGTYTGTIPSSVHVSTSFLPWMESEWAALEENPGNLWWGLEESGSASRAKCGL